MLVQMFGDKPATPRKVKDHTPPVKKPSRTKGGPNSHYHNWSCHTHHNRPKGGNHYRAVRRRQRPWRIGFLVGVTVVITGLAVIAVSL